MLSIDCPLCNSKFSKNFLLKHLKIFHAGKCFNLVCKFIGCSRKYTNVSGFMKHVVIHLPPESIDNIIGEDDVDENSTFVATQEAAAEDNKITPIDVEIAILSCKMKKAIIHTDNISSIKSNKSTINVVTEFSQQISDAVDVLVADLYADKYLLRTYVAPLIKKFKNFYDTSFGRVLEDLNAANPNIEITKILNIMKNIDQNHKTEKMSLKTFSSLYYIEPKTIHIATVMAIKRIHRRRRYTMHKITVEVVPMNQILKFFLEMPGVFSSIKNYIAIMERCECVCSIIQSNRWREIKQRYGNETVLPLTLYADAFCVNNPLGSHQKMGKIHAFYFYISCLPPEFKAQLENIFVAQLGTECNRKKVKGSKYLRPIVHQILHLQKHGLNIIVNGQSTTVYFDLFNISADNLEIHELLGLHQSFNAEYPCSRCLNSKEKCRTSTVIDCQNLRTVSKHEKDIQNKTNGVKDGCLLMSIPHFDIFKHVAFDYMHDFLEGILRYEMADVLNILIFKKKFMTYSVFAQRLENLNHIITGRENVCPVLKDTSIKKGKIIISAAEMKYLVTHLNVMLGDLISPGDEAWDLYLSARKIIMYLSSPSMNVESKINLKNLITSHLIMYKNVTQKFLKPKHHHATHYDDQIAELGLPRAVSCFRPEGKHKAMKSAVKMSTSRINTPKSMFIKHQLQQNHTFLLQKGLQQKFKFSLSRTNNITLHDDYEKFKEIITESIIDNYVVVSWFSIDGLFFTTDLVILTNLNADILEFGLIKHIFLNDSTQEVLLLYQKIKNHHFSEHFAAYHVSCTNEWNIVSYKNLNSKLTFDMCKLSNGKNYVLCKMSNCMH